MINRKEPNFDDPPSRRPHFLGFQPSREVKEAVPSVSILTPYFNAAELILETAAAVRKQTFQNWEWVIVDDGSDDRHSTECLTDLTRMDSRIRILRQENKGPAAARNYAFAYSRGEFLCLLDSDDMIEPTYLEKGVWFLESYPEFAFCNSWTVFFGDQQFLFKKGLNRGEKYLDVNIGPPIAILRRSLFEAAGGFDESIIYGHEDWDFWLKCACSGLWGATLPEFLQWYRKRMGGRYEQFMRDQRSHKLFKASIREKYHPLRRTFPKIKRRLPKPFEPIRSEITVKNHILKPAERNRTLFIVSWMVVGGADQVNFNVVKGLVERGHDVTICASLDADHTWLHRFSRLTPDIFVLPNFLHASDYPRFLAYIIASRCIDNVVIAGSVLGYLLLPYLKSEFPNTAFLDFCHVEEPHWFWGGYPRFSIGYRDLLDLHMVTTGHLANWMREHGVNDSHVKLIYTGVDKPSREVIIEERAKIRRELSLDDKVPIVIFAGRLCPQKNPKLLAEIIHSSVQAGLKFRALILGDGDQRGEFEELVAKYRLENVITTFGYVAHERWISLLSASDIFILSSEYEGISMALLEAMAHGVAPIVPKVGGHGEVLSPESGIMIERDGHEPDAYVAALRMLIGQPEKRIKMGEKAQERIAHAFDGRSSIENFAKALLEARHRALTREKVTLPKALALESARLAMEYIRANRRAFSQNTKQNGLKAKIANMAKSVLSWMKT